MTAFIARRRATGTMRNFRSRLPQLPHGGSHASMERNLVTLCTRCQSLVHDGFLDVEVAQCATSGAKPSFVFRDADGRRIERRAILGSRPLAQCAAATKAAPAFDAVWLAAHLDWFDDRGGRFTLRSRFRSQFAAVFGSRLV